MPKLSQSDLAHPDRPYPDRPHPHSGVPVLTLTGHLLRQNNHLTLGYCLQGNLTALAIASPTAPPTRQHNLWETTCFEFFLAPKDGDRYWEFNLSPSGNWNVYRFETYRQGIQEEAAIAALPFQVMAHSNQLSLTLNLDLTAIVPAEQFLAVAIATVIQFSTGNFSYWAIVHPTSEPDFHHRGGFILSV